MNNLANKTNSGKERFGSFPFPLCAVLIGVLLILASLLPLGDFAARSQWTDEDAKKFAAISAEYHRSAHQPHGRVKLPKEQTDIQHDQLKKSFKVVRAKLERAQQQPRRWSQYLLWSGALLAALGGFGHFAGRN